MEQIGFQRFSVGRRFRRLLEHIRFILKQNGSLANRSDFWPGVRSEGFGWKGCGAADQPERSTDGHRSD